MLKALAFLLSREDDPRAISEALQLINEEQFEALAGFARDITKLTKERDEAAQEREFFKSQFEQATGIEVD